MIIFNNEQLGTFDFPNGERGIKIPFIHGVNVIVLYYLSDQDLMDLMFLKRHIEEVGPGADTDLIIAYMPYSRMDRQNKDYLFTLKYVCDFINWLDFDRVRVVEPHSDVTCALLNRAKPVWIVQHMLPRIMEAIEFDPKLDYLIFPDAGAAKRYEELMNTHSFVGFKLRDFTSGDILAQSFVQASLDPECETFGNPKGRKALIVDDLCSRGGTFVNACGELHHLGFAEKHLLVAHCEPNVYTGDLFDCITSVHATTSLQEKSENSKLHLYDLEGLLYECL